MYLQRGIPCEQYFFQRKPTGEVPLNAYGHFSAIRVVDRILEFMLTTFIPNDAASNTHTTANMVQLLVKAMVRFPANTTEWNERRRMYRGRRLAYPDCIPNRAQNLNAHGHGPAAKSFERRESSICSMVHYVRTSISYD